LPCAINPESPFKNNKTSRTYPSSKMSIITVHVDLIS
jgi:hypothetical protein